MAGKKLRIHRKLKMEPHKHH